LDIGSEEKTAITTGLNQQKYIAVVDLPLVLSPNTL